MDDMKPYTIKSQRHAFKEAMAGVLDESKMMPAEPALEEVPPPMPEVLQVDEDYLAFGTKRADQLKPMMPQNDVPADAVLSERGGKKRYHRNTAFFTKRIDELVNAGFDDPMQVLMEIASGFKLEPHPTSPNRWVKVPIPKIDHKSRAIAATELLGYIYPKRKSVEVTGAEGEPIAFNLALDQSPIPDMPSDEEIERIALERRQQAALAARTLEARK